MAISRQGIEQMNGKIEFASKPGQGTTFTIELPLAKD
jgi:signal transduction histidine kinase